MTDVVKILRLAHARGLPLPTYESGQAAGMDLRAARGDLGLRVHDEADLDILCAVPAGHLEFRPGNLSRRV